jgi:hypothetical protein
MVCKKVKTTNSFSFFCCCNMWMSSITEFNHRVLNFANHAPTNLIGLLAMLSKNIMALVGGLSISFTWIYFF